MIRNMNDLKRYVNAYIVEKLHLQYKVIAPRCVNYSENTHDAIVLLHIMSLEEKTGEIILTAGIELAGHTPRVPVVGYGVFLDIIPEDNDANGTHRKPLGTDVSAAWAIAKAFYYWISGSKVEEIDLLETNDSVTDEVFRDIVNARPPKGSYN